MLDIPAGRLDMPAMRVELIMIGTGETGNENADPVRGGGGKEENRDRSSSFFGIIWSLGGRMTDERQDEREKEIEG